MRKYIFVIGGVMSSVGKGVVSSSIAYLLQTKGYRTTAVKADPYINVDAGTMNPVEHGEVFVTEDGDETDQDIGNYERFLNQNISRANYMTTGRVYLSVIERERNLEYAGKCVEVVPHIPQEIINRIEKAANASRSEITIVEIGGTVGEYQNILFLEAARMMKMRKPNDVVFVLVSYLPIPSAVGEMKTKPTQYAARTLNGAGIQADFIICRAEKELDLPRREKLATFCAIDKDNAISAPDLKSIYEEPLLFEKQNVGEKILKKLHLKSKKSSSNLSHWTSTVSKIYSAKRNIKIAIVGKYFGTGDFTLADSYISVIESVKIACWHQNINPKFSWINSEQFEKDKQSIQLLREFDGIIVPGGFGSRGIEGIIMTCEYARKNKIPYFGLCYGMQIAVIEFARNVAGLTKANTEEIDPKSPDPVIHIMKEQKEKVLKKDYGGSMRLGAYECKLAKGTKAFEAYQRQTIFERHRHRYEFNNDYRDNFEKHGLVISGVNPQNNLVEIIEIKNHPFFVGVQFHPEFKTRFLSPHPLFSAFIIASSKSSSK
ncbi:MAG: CTP synthase [Candidatus Berkelbacteria bacterium]|nr:CTP synthase [Candidatus Berkelbacteria bacterium]